MAVELCQDSSSTGISPRISFSHDLCLSDNNTVLIEPHPFRSTSSGSVDFDFCTRKSFDQDSSSADELFSDGKILPTEVKKKAANPARSSPPSIPHRARVLDDDAFAGTGSDDSPRKEGDQEKQTSKSFWRFKRSSSLNCGTGYGRTLCPLPLLSRSNSTGSTPSVKRSTVSKDGGGYNNQRQQNKQGSNGKIVQAMSSSSSSFSSSSCSGHQKPPLKKNYGSSYGNGVRVNPVINVPSGNLFGLGSIFFNNGKEKSSKKR